MSGHIKFAYCLAIWTLVGIGSQAHAHIWIDSAGRTVDAEFIRFDGATVFLRRPSGETLEVAFSKFSDPDKRRIEVLREQALKKEEALKTASAPDVAGMSAEEDAKDAPNEAEVRRDLKRTRKWTDKVGNQIQAKFVRIFEGNVILLQGNKGHNVEFYELCEADQSYLRDQMEILGEGDLVPPVVVRSLNNDIATSPNPPGAIPGMGGMGPGSMPRPNFSRPNAMGSFPGTMPGSSHETDQARRIREYNEKFAKSSLAGANLTNLNSAKNNADMMASNSPAPASTPAYDPWANQPAQQASQRPPRVTPPPMNMEPPSLPKYSAPKVTSSSGLRSPRHRPLSMSGRPMSGSHLNPGEVWECQTCHTQFDTAEKPDGCYFCFSLQIGGIVLLSAVGAAIRGVMS